MLARVRLLVPLTVGCALRLLLIASTDGNQVDLDAWQAQALVLQSQGIAAAYSTPVEWGTYPPGHQFWLYLAGVVGGLIDSEAGVRLMLRAFPAVADVVLIALIWYAIRVSGRPNWATSHALLYAVSPGALALSTYWSMFGDPLFTVGIVAGLLALTHAQFGWAWLAFTLGFMTKPQAWVFAPLSLFASLLFGGIKKTKLSLLPAFALAVIAIGPYFTELDRLIDRHMTAIQLFPWLSANAHNLWWLVSGGDGQQSDREPLLGALSSREIGLMLLGMAIIWAIVYLCRSQQRSTRSHLFAIWPAAAFVALSFFMLPTAIHENYSFAALPLLTIASAYERKLLPLAVVFSLTTAVNVALHDPVVLSTPWAVSFDLALLGIGNAAINVAIWTAFAVVLGLPLKDPDRIATSAIAVESAGRSPAHPA